MLRATKAYFRVCTFFIVPVWSVIWLSFPCAYLILHQDMDALLCALSAIWRSYQIPSRVSIERRTLSSLLSYPTWLIKQVISIALNHARQLFRHPNPYSSYFACTSLFDDAFSLHISHVPVLPSPHSSRYSQIPVPFWFTTYPHMIHPQLY